MHHVVTVCRPRLVYDYVCASSVYLSLTDARAGVPCSLHLRSLTAPLTLADSLSGHADHAFILMAVLYA